MKSILLSIFSALSLFLIAQPALAATNNAKDACATLQQQFENANAGAIVGALPQYCSTSGIYTKIINTLYYLIGFVAVIAIIYGGYLYMTASGNDAQVKKARSILTWTVIGVAVVMLAAVIVNVVVRLVVENKLV